MDTKNQSTRRKFLAGAASTTLGLTYIPSSVFARPAPSDRLNLGHIGIGGRGRRFLRPLAQLDEKVVPWENLGGQGDRFLRPALSTALCDVDSSRLDLAATAVGGRPRLYKDFRRLLEQKDLDAVVIASPDHWHALMMIMACQAGKDVYCEKPAAKTVEEGRAMVNAAERYGRVVQIGSQGRSQDPAHHAKRYINNGQIGTVSKVLCWHYENPRGDWTEDVQPPSGLDHESWIGPARRVAYNETRTHGRFRWMMDFGGGQIRDRGAHVMSVAQWIMDADYTGPVSVESTGESHHGGIYDTPQTMTVTYEFKDPDWTLVWAQPGVESEEIEAQYGAVYWGDKGHLTVTYGDRHTTDTEQKAKDFKTPYGGVEVFRSPGHFENFEDCIKSREKPIMHIESAHRVSILCILGNISYQLRRKLEWDPINERVKNDEEANRLLSRPGRGPWHL
jgi:predicted dehydrogenase